MKYNRKYDRWVTKGGLVYKYDEKNDRLVLCKLSDTKGYLRTRITKPKTTYVKVHRLVYETFVGEIPQGYVIDHINTIKTDNRLENLRCVTQKENQNNPLTRKHISESLKGRKFTEEHKRKISESKKVNGKPKSEFGAKFKSHFGFTKCENPRLYDKERMWYYKHHICRWEMNTDERN